MHDDVHTHAPALRHTRAPALRPTVRVAREADAPAIAALVNRAYRIERWFAGRDRTDEAEIRALRRDGAFLLLERASGQLAAAVYVRTSGGRGYFGMLAVDPALQRQGLGRRLVAVAEALCAAEGCTDMDLQTINLRTELPPWYRSLGYRECGTAPLDGPPTALPCHAIRMTKPLTADAWRQAS